MLENAQNGQNVEILFKPSRLVALPPARRRRGDGCRRSRGRGCSGGCGDAAAAADADT